MDTTMTRVEKWILRRDRIGRHLWDYSTILESNKSKKMRYLLTLDHVELYKDTRDITTEEINCILQAHIHAMGNGSIYDN